MARTTPTEAHDTAPQLPAALMAMTMHMLESRLALMGALARCGTVVEAGETMTRWMERRVAEFGEDQARVTEALLTGFAQASSAATDAATTAATAAMTVAATVAEANGKQTH